MDFVIDESVDAAITSALRNAGFEVWSVTEEEASITDDLVFQRAIEKNAILITADKDFGDIVFRRKLVNRGVILLRLAGLTAEEKCSLTIQALERHRSQLESAFTVVTAQQVRVRPLLP